MTDGQLGIVVKGWDGPELDQIISDFERKYGLSSAAFRIEASRVGYRIRLGQPVAADQVLYLINYMHYPEGFDLKGKSPTAIAFVRLNEAFGAITPQLSGRSATFYVPTNDREYDEVYAKLDSGAVYRVSFTDLAWDLAAESRQSVDVIRLRDSVDLLAADGAVTQ